VKEEARVVMPSTERGLIRYDWNAESPQMKDKRASEREANINRSVIIINIQKEENSLRLKEIGKSEQKVTQIPILGSKLPKCRASAAVQFDFVCGNGSPDRTASSTVQELERAAFELINLDERSE
jgi:hypothetical protein